MQQGLVAAGKAHHGVVDGGVAVGVQLHGLAHDIGAFGAGGAQQAHFIHGVKQLAVGGLKAVNLRDGPGHDDAHGVGHKVLAQGVADVLLDNLPRPGDIAPHLGGLALLGLLFLSWHDFSLLPLGHVQVVQVLAAVLGDVVLAAV